MVERNQGTIEIQSKVGKGTTFVLTFRIAGRAQSISEKVIPIRLAEAELAREKAV